MDFISDKLKFLILNKKIREAEKLYFNHFKCNCYNESKNAILILKQLLESK